MLACGSLGELWDLAAPSIIVEEAGGRFTGHWGGRRIDTHTRIFPAAPGTISFGNARYFRSGTGRCLMRAEWRITPGTAHGDRPRGGAEQRSRVVVPERLGAADQADPSVRARLGEVAVVEVDGHTRPKAFFCRLVLVVNGLHRHNPRSSIVGLTAA